MFQGYLRLGSVELTNAARTEAYVRNLLPGFPLRGCQGCDELAIALDESYDSPLQDMAPWIDPNNPATYNFLGFYPTAIEGLDGSTITAGVTESLGVGGYVGAARASTREILVRGVLVGTDDLALRAGEVWLNETLSANPCEGADCNGRRLDFFADCPTFPVCYGWNSFGGDGIKSGLIPGLTLPLETFGTDKDLHMEGQLVPIEGWDGLTINWGWSVYNGDTSNYLDGLVKQYGPVTPYRTNKVRNPQFSVNTGFWGTDATLTRVATGGPSGGSFGRLTAAGGTAHLQTSVATALSSPNMLQFQAKTTFATFVVNMRSTVDSSIIQTHTFTGSSTWLDYTLALPVARDTALEFVVTGTGTFDVTDVLVEAATQVFPYFDGDSIAAMQPTGVPDDPGYAVSWLGAANGSESRMVWLGNEDLMRFDFCGENMFPWIHVTSGYGSIYVRLGGSQTVPASEQVVEYQRYLNEVSRTSGPRATRDLKTSVGVGRIMEFVLVAGTPYIYADPISSAVGGELHSFPQTVFTDTTPPDAPPIVVVDPDCPPIPAPPRPPVIENDCVVTPGTWDRYTVPILSEYVPRYAFAVPVVEITPAEEMRQIRVRTYPNPLGVESARTNLATRPYPNAAGGWQSANGTLFPAVLDSTMVRRPGTKSSRINRSVTSPDSRIASWQYVGSYGTANANLAPIPVAGVNYVFSLWFAGENAPDARYAFTVYWYNGAGTLLGTQVQPTTISASSSGMWSRVSFTAKAPAGTTRARTDITFYTPSGGVATGEEVIWIQDAMVEASDYRFPLGTPYFDGAMDDADGLAYAWTGTAFASTSTATIEPFGYNSEFIVSYAPAGARIVMDAQTHTSTIYLASAPSSPVSAANLLYGPDGGPMVWPELSCGISYFATFDVPPGTGEDTEMDIRMPRRE